jgi:hypothetical protein
VNDMNVSPTGDHDGDSGLAWRHMAPSSASVAGWIPDIMFGLGSAAASCRLWRKRRSGNEPPSRS